MRDEKGRAAMIQHMLLVILLFVVACKPAKDLEEREEKRAEQSVASQLAAESAAEAKALDERLKETTAKIKSLASAIATEPDESRRKILQAQLEAASDELNDTRRRRGLPPASGAPVPAKTACTCKATDPLCDCL